MPMQMSLLGILQFQHPPIFSKLFMVLVKYILQ
jgi:hypothetical protein